MVALARHPEFVLSPAYRTASSAVFRGLSRRSAPLVTTACHPWHLGAVVGAKTGRSTKPQVRRGVRRYVCMYLSPCHLHKHTHTGALLYIPSSAEIYKPSLPYMYMLRGVTR